MRPILTGLLMLLSVTCPLASAQTSTPAATSRAFLQLRVDEPYPGAPGGRALMQIAPLLDAELTCLLGTASRYRDAFITALPEEAPPLTEGDLFSSHASGVNQFTPAAPVITAGRARIRVNLKHSGSNSEEAREWNDEIVLRQLKQRWLIQDIEFHGDFPGARSGSLIAMLRHTLANPDPRAGWDAAELKGCPSPEPAKKASKPKTPTKPARKPAARR
jgi:hypothetical protein